MAPPQPQFSLPRPRSEEHTSELQSRRDLVCRLLLEKKHRIPGEQVVCSGWWRSVFVRFRATRWRNRCGRRYSFFFFNDTATTEIYTLSLHDALPICRSSTPDAGFRTAALQSPAPNSSRSEEHTSELQSRRDLVCRLLLEKKKKE